MADTQSRRRLETSIPMITPSDETVIVAVLWILSFPALLLLNEYLLRDADYRINPIFLTLLHMISCTLCSFIAVFVVGIVPFQRISSPKQFLKISALSALFSLSAVCGNVSLTHLPLSLTIAIAGATRPIFVAVFDNLITGRKESTAAYLALLLLMVGMVSVNISITESSPSWYLGSDFCFIMCVGAALGALKSVAQELLLKSDSEKMDSVNLLLYMAPMSALILLPLALYLEGNVFAVEKKDWCVVVYILIASSGGVAYLMNWTNMWLTKHTTALTSQVLGSLKVCLVVIFFGLSYRDNVMKGTQYVNVATGVVVYLGAKKESIRRNRNRHGRVARNPNPVHWIIGEDLHH